jgi:hypothetical protein
MPTQCTVTADPRQAAGRYPAPWEQEEGCLGRPMAFMIPAKVSAGDPNRFEVLQQASIGE